MVKETHFMSRIYIVQDILDTRWINGAQQYKVKWKDYSLSECTWEPEQSFNCSREILHHFLYARTLQQPAFKDKILKVEKQREKFQKSKTMLLIKQKSKAIKRAVKIRKSGDLQQIKKKRLQEDSDSDSDLESDSDSENDHSEPSNISQKQSLQSSEKAIVTKKITEKRNQAKEKQEKFSRNQKKLKKRAEAQLKEISNLKGNLASRKSLQFLTVRREKGKLQFYVLLNKNKVWLSHRFVHQCFPRELCQYYEKYLMFEN